MMTFENFIATLKSTLQKTKVEKLAAIAAQGDFSVRDIIDATFYPEEQLAFRAAWILENIYTRYPDRFLPHTRYFLDSFPKQQNFSCQRHFCKILALMTAAKAPVRVKEFIAQYDTAKLVETVFSWLIDDDVPVAVKSHCLNILANFSVKHCWIRDELQATIDFLVDKESIAFYAKAKQIRKQLKF